MKIALFGASGKIGRYIAAQAIARGHEVSAIVRRTTDLPKELKDCTLILLEDVRNSEQLTQAVAGHDLIASALGFVEVDDDQTLLPDVTHALINAARDVNIPRIMVVGGAGCLYLTPTKLFLDSPQFPDQFRPFALGQVKAVTIFRQVVDVDWMIFVPAADIYEGEEIGNYRVGANKLIYDHNGLSRISYPDFANAFVDEIEQHRFLYTLATVAY